MYNVDVDRECQEIIREHKRGLGKTKSVERMKAPAFSGTIRHIEPEDDLGINVEAIIRELETNGNDEKAP